MNRHELSEMKMVVALERKVKTQEMRKRNTRGELQACPFYITSRFYRNNRTFKHIPTFRTTCPVVDGGLDDRSESVNGCTLLITVTQVVMGGGRR